MFQPSASQVKEWKEQYGELFQITVDDYCCILHKPSRKQLSYASVAGKTDPLKFNELILRDCWIAGDEVIKTDDTLFLSVSAKVGELIEIKSADMVKL